MPFYNSKQHILSAVVSDLKFNVQMCIEFQNSKPLSHPFLRDIVLSCKPGLKWLNMITFCNFWATR